MNVNVVVLVFLMQVYVCQDFFLVCGFIVNMLDIQMMLVFLDWFSYFCGKFVLEGVICLVVYDFVLKGICVNVIVLGLILLSDQIQENFDVCQKLIFMGLGFGLDDIVVVFYYFFVVFQVIGYIFVVDVG